MVQVNRKQKNRLGGVSLTNAIITKCQNVSHKSCKILKCLSQSFWRSAMPLTDVWKERKVLVDSNGFCRQSSSLLPSEFEQLNYFCPPLKET